MKERPLSAAVTISTCQYVAKVTIFVSTGPEVKFSYQQIVWLHQWGQLSNVSNRSCYQQA